MQNLDGPIRANRFADSRESSDSRESFQGSRSEPFFANRAPRGYNIANRRFEAIRTNRSKVMSEDAMGGWKKEGGGKPHD